MAALDDLVAELDRSYAEAQERMSDPAVYNDHREAADVARLEEELKLALAERDPADEKDVIVEIRGGEGGDEGKLWAGDLARLLQRYAERRGFRWEEIEVTPSDAGGIKEATYAIKGDGAYTVFKFEGGTHRVQRVPETESQGRIHTSTAT